MATISSPFRRKPVPTPTETPANPTDTSLPTVTVEEVEDDQDNQENDNAQEDQDVPEEDQPEITGQETLLQPPGDQQRASTSQPPDSSPREVPPEFPIFAKVFGKAIQQLVEEQDLELTGKAKEQQELVKTYATEELPISAFIRMTMEEDAKKQGKVMGITSGYWRIWQKTKNISPLPIKEAITKYHKLPIQQRRQYANIEVFYPLCLDAYTREGTPSIRKTFQETVEFANKKWRTPGNLIPKVYPSEFDFKCAAAMQ